MAWVAAREQGFEREVPLEIRIVVYRRKPKSVKREYPTSRPDLDNYEKLIADSLEGFAYVNDSQIVDSRCSKRYSKRPRVEIEIAQAGDFFE